MVPQGEHGLFVLSQVTMRPVGFLAEHTKYFGDRYLLSPVEFQSLELLS